MFQRVREFLALVSTAVAVGHAGITVTVTGDGNVVGSPTITSNGDGVDVTVVVVTDNQVNVAVNATAQDIIKTLNIKILSDRPNDDPVRANLTLQGSGSGRVVRCENIVRDGTSDSQADLQISVVRVRKTTSGTEGNLGVAGSSQGGVIQGIAIGVVDVEGNITADVTAIDGETTGLHSITTITCDGIIVGDITAPYGGIDEITAGGAIGTVGSPITISAGTALSSTSAGRILYIEGADVHANITTNTAGFVQYIGATGAGSADGDFTGTVTTNDMTCGMCMDARRGILVEGDMAAAIIVMDRQGEDFEVGGDLTGSITITNDADRPITIVGAMNGNVVVGRDLLDPFSSGSIVSTRTLRIGRTLGAAGDIAIGASGLIGQIVVNASNSSGTWSGDVTVGSTTLATTPYYSNLPSALGGGAVGLVPYRVHGAASVPASGSTVLTDPASVTVVYYGRLINLATGSETPMAIRKRAIASPMGDWVTVTSNYNYAVSGRTVTITPKSGHTFDGWFEWEITPVAGELKCANTTAASDSAAADVHTGALTFSVTPTEGP